MVANDNYTPNLIGCSLKANTSTMHLKKVNDINVTVQSPFLDMIKINLVMESQLPNCPAANRSGEGMQHDFEHAYSELPLLSIELAISRGVTWEGCLLPDKVWGSSLTWGWMPRNTL